MSAKMRPARHGRIVAALVVLVVVLSLATAGAWSAVTGGLAAPRDALSSPAQSTVATTGPGSAVINLLNGNQSVSPALIYNGYYGAPNASFPVLLSGSAASQFWPSDQTVMELAPQVSYVYGHDAGLLEYPSDSQSAWQVDAVGVASPVLSGDGFAAYFLVTPTSTANWSSDLYATSPVVGVAGPLSCQGTVIFPPSLTPYVVVQWDPAWTLAGCGAGTSGDFNLYLVSPGPGGNVSASNIWSFGPLSASSPVLPAGGDYLNVSASYSLATDSVNATVTDVNNSAVAYSFSANLSAYAFVPPPLGTNVPYVGLGGSGNNHAGWGLLYLGGTAATIAPSSDPSSTSHPSSDPPSGLLSGLGSNWLLFALVGAGAGAVVVLAVGLRSRAK